MNDKHGWNGKQPGRGSTETVREKLTAVSRHLVGVMLLVIMTLLCNGRVEAAVFYAAPGGATSGTCSSWATACELHYALSVATYGNDIWVKQGTYKPTTSTDRNATFQLKNGVYLYGGFNGTETAVNQRFYETYFTILSGDLNGDDAPGFTNYGDNSYHVVTGVSGAVLDGFTITGGNAVGGAVNSGGGMYNNMSSMTIANCTFSNNYGYSGGGMYNMFSTNLFISNCTFHSNAAATATGGGMYNNNSSPMLTGCKFNYNTAPYGGGMYNVNGSNSTLSDCSFLGNSANYGGGIYNSNSSPSITNCTFDGNTANQSGGAIDNNGSSPVLSNCTFSGNTSSFGGGISNSQTSNPTLTSCTFSGNSASYGGGIYSNTGCAPIIRNSILWGSNTQIVSGLSTLNVTQSVVQGGYPGTGNISADPYLGPLGYYNGVTKTIPLLPGSSAINAGNPANCAASDQRGKARVGVCDIGAFESQGFVMAKTGGDGQTAALFTPFADPLSLNVTPNNSIEPVNGGVVTFTAPGSGAGITGANPFTANISGGVVSQGVTANGSIGSYSIAVSTTVATGVSYSLTNITDLDTILTGTPANPGGTDALFTFTGSGGTGERTFECQLDGNGWNACSSPQTYSGLSLGSHTFQVRSRDSIGSVDPTPASYTWLIATYSVTYNGNNSTGGIVPIDGAVYYPGDMVTVQANSGNLVKTGAGFTGWNTAADGSGTLYPASGSATFAMGGGNVTLYAQWVPDMASVAVSGTNASLATLSLQSSASGRGYFTLLAGSGTACGSGDQVRAGQDASGAAAYRRGSLPLSAGVAASYTVRNLTAETMYTVCFAAADSVVQSSPVTATLTTTAAASYASPAWNVAGAAGFSSGAVTYTSLAFAPDGSPYVAYVDGGSASKATVMRYDGNGWVVVGGAGFSAGTASYLSLAFAPDGSPYVAYVDGGSASKATVMRYDGNGWVVVGGAGFSAGTASYLSLAFAPDGAPYVAYQDGNASSSATVMRYDGSSWGTVGSAGFSAGTVSYLSLAFAPDGAPYVAYQDGGASNRATVMNYNGSSWGTVGSAGLSAGTASYLSLAFAPDGTPYVAYEDGGTSNRATVMNYNGSSWGTVGSAGISAGTAIYLSLAFAPDGSPHVAYQDGAAAQSATVLRYTVGSWATVGSAGFSAGRALYLSLSFAPDGTPYVAYRDAATANKGATVMRLVSTSAPGVSTGAASTIAATSATLNGTVNAGGVSTTVTFDYGLDTAYGSSAAAAQSPLSNAINSAVSAAISGLSCGTTYHFRVNATNTNGTTNGLAQSFTTGPCTASLTVTIVGNGSVTSDNGSGINDTCNTTGVCPAVIFNHGDTVTLTATGSNSTFSGWSGDVSGTTNPYTGLLMNGDKAVTATFTPDPALVQIQGSDTVYYTLISAMTDCAQVATILARDTVFGGGLTVTGNTITLRGGFPDANFTTGSQSGYTTINGTLAITGGKLIAERVKVGP